MGTDACADLDALLHASAVDWDGVPHADAVCGVWMCANWESKRGIHDLPSDCAKGGSAANSVVADDFTIAANWV